MKKYLLAGVLVLLLATILAIPLLAAETKIKLPDGLYMYDSSISKREDGREWVGFRTFFVVQNNIIYSSQGAMNKFGVSKLNKLFTENKKYKILFGGEQVGEIYNVKIGKFNNELDWNYEEKLFTKNIKQGPAYGKESIYLGRLGSAAKCLAVPEEYKEGQRKVYTTIPQEEVDKIAKLAKEKLLPLVINRKELTQYEIRETELYKEYLELLDKITNADNEIYIGIYRYVFKISPDSIKISPDSRPYRARTIVPAFEIVFSVKNNTVNVITSDYDSETLSNGNIKILDMLDIDGCGKNELLIEKEYGGMDEVITNLEVYKQKIDGSWTQIKKIRTRRQL
jgi:hypothetical protein